MKGLKYYTAVTISLLLIFSACTRKVELVEFVDYQCPSCKSASSYIEKLRKEFKGKLKVTVKNLPLVSIHPYAMKAALAAECAREQGRFWEMYFNLFQWSPKLSEDDLYRIASGIGLNMKKFIPCMGSEKIVKRVEADVSEAKKLGISGTPTFLIGNEIITGVPAYETLRNMIKHAVDKGPYRHGEVEITVINDVTCPTCTTSKFVDEIKKVFFNHKIRNLSPKEKAGEELMKKLGISWLPAIILTGSLDEYANFHAFYPSRFVKKGEYYVVYPQYYQIGYSEKVPPVDPLTTVGPANPDVIIIHYTGFPPSCRGCRDAFSYIESAVRSFKGKVAVSYKFFITKPQDPSYMAAMAALCAGEQGRFVQMMVEIYKNGFKDDYSAYAKKAGVNDLKDFQKCVKELRYRENLERDVREAVNYWVPFSPYTFVNKYRFPYIPNPSWLKGLISDLITLSQRNE